MIEGFIRMMATGDDVTGPINLGNPVELPMVRLAERIIELTGSKSCLVNLPLPTDDPVQRCPDISKARDTLGWQPAVALDDGLTRTIAYFDRLLSGRAAG
jgi:UDP-glucuronate decarboxylase